MKRSRLGEYALIAEPRKSFSSFVYAFGVAVNNLDDVVEPDDQCGDVARWRRGDVATLVVGRKRTSSDVGQQPRKCRRKLVRVRRFFFRLKVLWLTVENE
jgi:hypothetical protein